MVLALGPVGCGFQPIYARSGGEDSSALAQDLAAVRVAAIDDRIGQQLRNSLVLSLSPRGEPAKPRYMLSVQLSEVTQGMANSDDGAATVGRVNLSARYVLSDVGTGKPLYTSEARAYGGFRYQGPRYASTASERDSENSAVLEVAAEIRSALAAYFSDPETFQQRQKQTRPLPKREPPAP